MGRDEEGWVGDDSRETIFQDDRRGVGLEGRSKRVYQEKRHYKLNLIYVLTRVGYTHLSNWLSGSEFV